jgi:hypothetical protein
MNDDARDSSASRGSVANDQAEVLAQGIANIVAVLSEPDWISADERLPTYSDAIWVFDGKDVFMGEFWGGTGFQSYGASCDREGLNSETLHGITHWAEIKTPQPPTDSK